MSYMITVRIKKLQKEARNSVKKVTCTYLPQLPFTDRLCCVCCIYTWLFWAGENSIWLILDPLPIDNSIILLLLFDGVLPLLDPLSVCLFLNRFLISSSFSSINDRNVWIREDFDLDVIWPLGSSSSSSGVWWRRNCFTVSAKYTIRATKQAMPQTRKSPQKLFNSSLFTSSCVSCVLQAFLISHLSWIFCKSPFSESFSKAVDMSTANGESWGNACGVQESNL